MKIDGFGRLFSCVPISNKLNACYVGFERNADKATWIKVDCMTFIQVALSAFLGVETLRLCLSG